MTDWVVLNPGKAGLIFSIGAVIYFYTIYRLEKKYVKGKKEVVS